MPPAHHPFRPTRILVGAPHRTPPPHYRSSAKYLVPVPPNLIVPFLARRNTVLRHRRTSAPISFICLWQQALHTNSRAIGEFGACSGVREPARRSCSQRATRKRKGCAIGLGRSVLSSWRRWPLYCVCVCGWRLASFDRCRCGYVFVAVLQVRPEFFLCWRLLGHLANCGGPWRAGTV